MMLVVRMIGRIGYTCVGIDGPVRRYIVLLSGFIVVGML